MFYEPFELLFGEGKFGGNFEGRERTKLIT